MEVARNRIIRNRKGERRRKIDDDGSRGEKGACKLQRCVRGRESQGHRPVTPVFLECLKNLDIALVIKKGGEMVSVGENTSNETPQGGEEDRGERKPAMFGDVPLRSETTHLPQ